LHLTTFVISYDLLMFPSRQLQWTKSIQRILLFIVQTFKIIHFFPLKKHHFVWVFHVLICYVAQNRLVFLKLYFHTLIVKNWYWTSKNGLHSRFLLFITLKYKKESFNLECYTFQGKEFSMRWSHSSNYFSNKTMCEFYLTQSFPFNS